MRKKKLLDAALAELRERAKSNQLTQRQRAGLITGITYRGIDREGDVEFQCNSQDRTKRYTQYFRFHDLKTVDINNRDDVLRMFRESDLGVSCNDPSFLFWGGAYNATKEGHNIASENRPPQGGPTKSPKVLALQKKFTLCKHLIAVSQALPFYWNTMMKDLIKWQERYGKKDIAKTDLAEKNKVEEVEVQTTKQETEEGEE